MPKATVRANAQALPEAKHLKAAAPETAASSDLEDDIYRLVRMLRAIVHLQDSENEELQSAARFLTENACKMAEDLDLKYQKSLRTEKRGGSVSSEEAIR
jgi:hypothetical protein